MRLIVISLLLINLVYLGYQFTQPVEINQASQVDVPVQSDGQSIKLVSELSVPIEKTENKTDGGELCWAVGPYLVELDAKHLYARMLAMDIQAKVATRAEIIKKEFWVYIPPFSNRKQAMRKLKELQKRNVDSYVITEGDLENGISLGLFSKQSLVDRLTATLDKKNIQSSVRPLTRTRNHYWVLAPVSVDAPINEKTRERLMEGQELPWLQIRCDSGLPNE